MTMGYGRRQEVTAWFVSGWNGSRQGSVCAVETVEQATYVVLDGRGDGSTGVVTLAACLPSTTQHNSLVSAPRRWQPAQVSGHGHKQSHVTSSTSESGVRTEMDGLVLRRR